MSPRTASSAPATLVPVDPDDVRPLHQQVYAALRDAILGGALRPGARLPATRTLAIELGVSRNTTSAAVDQLRAEGYVETRPRSGAFVSATIPAVPRCVARPVARAVTSRAASAGAPRKAALPAVSRFGAAAVEFRLGAWAPSAGAPRAFRTGLPALDAFPWRLWTRLVARRMRRSGAAIADYAAPAGFAPLREAIAAYVAAARGARCTADQVIVTSGAQQALDLLARVLVDVGDVVWLEEPGYGGARAAFGVAGARLVPVPLDAAGLDVAAGGRRAPDARLVYVTPSHQYPEGVTMSAARRLELLAWARNVNAWIVEDDYDSEFRYTSRPLPCLQGLDDTGRVLYVGTFSKTMFPGLRLGYAIVPASLVDVVTRARAIADRHTPTIDQAALADFLGEGHFARHVRQMRALYAERLDALTSAVEHSLGDHLVLGAVDAGMHATGWLPPGADDRAIARAALERGLETPPLSHYALEPLRRGGLLLGYAAFTPAAIRSAVRRLAPVLARGAG